MYLYLYFAYIRIDNICPSRVKLTQSEQTSNIFNLYMFKIFIQYFSQIIHLNPAAVSALRNGSVYYTVSDTNFGVHQGALTMLAGPAGRLMRYDEKTRASTVVIDDMSFANGVVLSEKQERKRRREGGHDQEDTLFYCIQAQFKVVKIANLITLMKGLLVSPDSA